MARKAFEGRNWRGSRVALLFLLFSLASVKLFGAAQKSVPLPTNDDCLACHGDSTLTHEVNGKSVSLFVDVEKFKNSTHGGMFQCVVCHTDLKTSPHENTPANVSCSKCNADEQIAYERSFHANAIKAGDGQAATCVDCHGSPHELLAASDPKSKVNHANIPATCGSCHGQKFVMAASDPKSSIFKFNVPTTCAKCHGPIEQQFAESIHGQAITRGNWQAPVCTDCHGIHSIKSHLDPNSPVNAQNVALVTCARCHEGVRLSQEFGFEGRRATTYLASYHGLASKLGSQVVANCASCHGVHNILPSSDPRSTINHANLARTCGQCHPGVTEKFTAARVHVDAPLSADVGSKAV